MMLLSFHIVAIALLVVVVGNIAYQMGKKRGMEIMQREFEEERLLSRDEETPKPPKTS